MCGRQSLFSPPTTKQDILSPSKTVSALSLCDRSGVVRIGGSCWTGGGGVTNGSGEEYDTDFFFLATAAAEVASSEPKTVLGPCKLFTALNW